MNISNSSPPLDSPIDQLLDLAVLQVSAGECRRVQDSRS